MSQEEIEKNLLEYKGFHGPVHYSKNDHCLHGKVIDSGRDVILYEGKTVEEIEKDFRSMIDFYLGDRPDGEQIGAVWGHEHSCVFSNDPVDQTRKGVAKSYLCYTDWSASEIADLTDYSVEDIEKIRENQLLLLQMLRSHEAGLNERLQAILARIPAVDDFASVKQNSVNELGMAQLSAYTDNEFFLLQGESENILYRAKKGKCSIENNELIMDLLLQQKATIRSISHVRKNDPGLTKKEKALLQKIRQQKAYVVSSVTMIARECSVEIPVEG